MAGKSTCTVTNEQVAEALKKYPKKKDAAKALGTNSTTLLRWEKYGVPQSKKEPVERFSKPSDGLTLDKILKQHHPVEKFVSVVDTVPKGEFHADTDMQRLCELSQQSWARLKRNERVQDYKVRLPDGSVVWGSKQDAALLRRKLMEA